MAEYVTRSNISPELLEAIEKVTSKRPRVVLEHILKYGYVTTEDLAKYGYKHEPRAARDVREQGIPLETFSVKSSDGRTIAAYKLIDEGNTSNKNGGRRSFSKKFKLDLLSLQGEHCALCEGAFPSTTLQIDHKVPYEVGGDTSSEHDLTEFMLLCPSCNRAKSWTCEHCDNWRTIKSVKTCKLCMFGSPNHYEHIAMKEQRNLTLVWEGEEIQEYKNLEDSARLTGQNIHDYAKDILKNILTSSEQTKYIYDNDISE